ncbi:uncharacterized protein LOC113378535 [Ctenocephalides felis]|uniref:uncharacterized protein LOC113378535 n=1 Tax=Ctenocephalides felis TaxID=7515 RepID=UPI000E6E3675|nr:uncharacterized protein LOC113378535 [Ctenocephalides felis]
MTKFIINTFLTLLLCIQFLSIKCDNEENTFECHQITKETTADKGSEVVRCLEWIQLDETDNTIIAQRNSPLHRAILVPTYELAENSRVNCVNGQRPDSAGICREAW